MSPANREGSSNPEEISSPADGIMPRDSALELTAATVPLEELKSLEGMSTEELKQELVEVLEGWRQSRNIVRKALYDLNTLIAKSRSRNTNPPAPEIPAPALEDPREYSELEGMSSEGLKRSLVLAILGWKESRDIGERALSALRKYIADLKAIEEKYSPNQSPGDK
jgi:hypothetical protein